MQNNRLKILGMIVAIILLIPLIAMQFTTEVNWTIADFIVAGVLLLSTGLLCELAIRKIKNVKVRVALCLGMLAFLVLIWAELAVGIFGSPVAGS
jgi:membrane protein CcdC involved in cytochrome C biogenesis